MMALSKAEELLLRDNLRFDSLRAHVKMNKEEKR